MRGKEKGNGEERVGQRKGEKRRGESGVGGEEERRQGRRKREGNREGEGDKGGWKTFIVLRPESIWLVKSRTLLEG